MGTRGYFAIVYKGKLYACYCHFDAYPQRPGMGWTLVQEIQWANLEMWKYALENIKIAEGKPTQDDIDQLREYTDMRVSNNSTEDWYCLTRKCQGSILKTLQSGYFNGSVSKFDEAKLVDSLGGEWSYVVDFDNNEFRTFSGSNEIHIWKFRLDAIPLQTFEEPSIRAFNYIADGDEFKYTDNNPDVVSTYMRVFEEQKVTVAEERKEKKLKAAEKPVE